LIDAHRTLPLTEGWRLISTEPGAAATPDALPPDAAALPAQVPGTVAGAHVAAGRDVFRAPQAFDAQDHWFATRFARPALAPAEAAARIELAFEGLATIAEVWLNGERVLDSDSMFVRRAVDVGARLRDDNDLFICFRSLDRWLDKKKGRPRWRTRLTDHQQLRFARTSLIGRTPGFTPPVHAVGPFRRVALIVKTALDVLAKDVRVTPPASEGGTGGVQVRLCVRALDGSVSGAELVAGSARAALSCSADGDACVVSGGVQVESAALWWPHTHGAQPLYAARVRVQVGAAWHEIDLGRVGFRRVELVEDGGRFALRVNGVEIFCRGACWTSADAIALDASDAAYARDLEAARDAGMNMLRISGNMNYEADAFYRLCDELGILVFQDFMFSNMCYPLDDAAFAANVDAEVAAFLGRTQSRACLALLCGGSEVEQQIAMLGLPRADWRQPLFYDVLPAHVARLRPDVPYWPSSPSGGALPFDADSGVTHYYGVGAYLRPLDDARRAEVKFAAECLAFSNVPDASAFPLFLRDGEAPVHHPSWKARVARDVGASWDFEDVREHYLRALFGVDPLALRYTDVERYLALSRVVTGEVMASALCEWRRARSTCRGALIWFYRDLWPGAGLGLLDATGKPKAAYYYVKRALAPAAVFFSDEGLNGLHVHVVNDRPAPLAATLAIKCLRDEKGGAVAAVEHALEVPARGQVELKLHALLPWFFDTTYAYRFGPAAHRIVVATLSDAREDRVLGDAFYFPLGLPKERAAEIGLQAQVERDARGYLLHLSARDFAQSVAIDVPGFLPEHDYLHLAPGARRSLRLSPLPGTAPGAACRGRAQPLNAVAATKIEPAPP
jgi:beta-mannosidase